MADWEKVFGSYLNSGMYNKESGDTNTGIKRAAIGSGLEFFRIDLKGVTGKADFLKRAAKTLGFPAYFGMNWDAFNDSLMDLSWKPAAGYVLLLTNVHMLNKVGPADADVVKQIFSAAAEFWKKKKVSFYIILSG
jgi:hypothetical protein